MKDIDQIKESYIKPILRINLKDGDLRTGPKDRRQAHTYVADDRRSGIADRRKN